MTIFAILLPSPQPALEEAIKTAYPNEYLSINSTQWLVSSSETAIEITAKIGVYDEKNPTSPPTGNAVVFAISSYYGRAPTNIWDWIKSKLEAPSRG